MKLSTSFAIAGTFLGLMGVHPSVFATNYFSWDVETDYTPQSTYKVQYAERSVRDCTVAHRGLCSMRVDVVGVDGGNQQRGADVIEQKKLPFNVVGGPALYYRTWMKIMPGFSWGSPRIANVKTSREIGGSYPRFLTGHMRSDGFYVAECDTVTGYPGGGCLTTSGVANNDYGIQIPYNVAGMADGKWHEYILRIKPNSTTAASDAEFQVWVDASSVGTLKGWKLSNSPNPNAWIEAWGGWMVYPYFQMNGTSTDGGTIYLDDFSTDDAWNSLLGGAASPPAAPSNLRVQ
jgi:hypothetical protein